MKLYTVITTLLAVVAGPLQLAATTDAAVNSQANSQIEWSTDFDASVAKAKAESKPLFVYFEGSDWCSWCMKMNKQIINTSEFQTAVKDKLIFVMVDFPKKSNADDRTKAQNDKLLEQFGVKGFPTVLILDPNMVVLDKLGFQQGGGALYAKKVQDVVDAYNKKKAGA